MITAKQANTLTKLSIAKKALESAIDAFNDNIVKDPDTPVYRDMGFKFNEILDKPIFGKVVE